MDATPGGQGLGGDIFNTPVPSRTAREYRPLQRDGGAGPAAAGATEELTYVWATGIAVEHFKEEARVFFETFRRGSEPIPHFVAELQKLRLREGNELPVDFTELAAHAPSLYRQVVAHPGECLQMMAAVAEGTFRALYPDVPADYTIAIAAHSMPAHVSLRELAPEHIETLVAVRGMVVRTSKLIPEVRVAHFRCWVCHSTERSGVDRGRIFEPVRCAHCGRQYTYQLVHNMSVYEDKQVIRVQEAPENLAEGETPVTVSVVTYGDLVDTTVPGDRVVVTGIYRSAPLKLNANTRIIKAVFRTHVDAVHIERCARNAKRGGEGGGGASVEDVTVDPSDVAAVDQLYQLARRPDISAILLRSLAPNIWGHEDVKRGILAQLFGGSRKTFKHGHFRSELNIIMCGDPGVAKSQLLAHVHSISPRGVYTSGKGSSSVGLTAFVVKDADTGEFVLEPGALVLSDRGICCIDEFDKMDDSTRSILHEVMEQQTLSIAKAGIIATLNARTSILAAANPKQSQWNPALNIVENLEIEPTLLSRFDLIFLLLDREDEALDRQLAAHVLRLYVPLAPGAAGAAAAAAAAANSVSFGPGGALLEGDPAAPVLATRNFARYVAYARAHVTPRLTEESHAALVNAFVDLRHVRSGGKTVATTLRQLESMIRLAEARAKQRYAATVSVEDVAESRQLVMSALKDAATDPRTGLINMDMFCAPDPNRTSVEACAIRLEAIIRGRYLAHGRKSAPLQELRHALNEDLRGQRPLPQNQFSDVLAQMEGEGVVASFTASTVIFAAGAG